MLTPNTTYQMNGVTVREKIIPDGTRWKDATKAAKAGFSANALYKAQKKLCGTGKPSSVTIHNTNDLPNVYDDGEQYTRATFNENMNSSRVHFFVDDTGAWQNLKAGTGLCSNDPVGGAEVSWHSGDGSVSTGGNMTSISIEIIMNDTAEHDAAAKDNGAKIAAWLLWKNGLTINQLVSHTYWVNKSAGKNFTNVDEQCTNPIYGKKWCPTYIFGSSNKTVALKNWKAFKAIVERYLNILNAGNAGTQPKPQTPATGGNVTVYRVRKTWSDSKSQIGAFNVLDNAKRLADANPGYFVFDGNGKAVYPATTPYKVRVTVDNLHIRTGPGTGYSAAGFTGKGIFTIVEESPGEGATAWGKLKSGAGWISLDYAEKV